ncbi:hypothetical protein DRW41_08265 [Neobacillus piezotolerans]|uniref:Uncharacterized protein n=1 Tax=Neobacillus piezotolerans TaxID=2259171 RepID=A0A3D8GU59_9BACI|nr:hypothetical protein DRW41_08265 [Neobacillus piezotolerans]
MKRYIAFLISFILLYMFFEVISGSVLTALYTPDLYLVSNSLNGEVLFARPSSFFFLGILFIATLAYFFSQKLFREPSK